MSASRRTIKRSELQRRVFSRTRQPRQKPLWRLIGEAALMLAGGALSLAILNWLSQKFDGIIILSEAIADLISGIIFLIEALLGFGSVILIGALVFIGIILFFGGIWRIIRIAIQMLKSRNTSNSISNRKRRHQRS